MSSNKKTSITELDFDRIKENLKTYLSGQDNFKDYDFDGSNLSVLLDVMAYNTMYNSQYASMLSNESFLDTSVKRENVVSKAKENNYTPKSLTASRAVIDIEIEAGDMPTQISIPKGTIFSSTLDGKNYNFVTMDEYIAEWSGSGAIYKAPGVELIQGDYTDYRYRVDSDIKSQKFVIPQTNIDTSTLKIAVQESIDSTDVNFYNKTISTTSLDGNSKVYFLEEGIESKYYFYFGDNILGYKPPNDSIVIAEYIISSEEVNTNGISQFNLEDDIGGYSNITIITDTPAYGWGEREDIDSIKFNAPKFFQSQDRAVTANDYEVVLRTQSNVIQERTDSISVWGGEDNDPPVYGKIFISLKPKPDTAISDTLKDRIVSTIINPKRTLSITPEFVDPEYLYIDVLSTVTYDSSKSADSANEIKTKVIEEMEKYNDQVLEFFHETFRYSTFVNRIDASHISVHSNNTSIKLRKNVDVDLNENRMYKIKYNNSLKSGTLVSTYFFINEINQNEDDQYYFEDDGENNVILKKLLSDGNIEVVDEEFGNIDYINGVISLDSFTPVELFNTEKLEMTVEPSRFDVYTIRNMLLSFGKKVVIMEKLNGDR